MALGERVRSARMKAGLSQSALARRLGIRPSAINHIEAGRTKALKAETLVALANELAVSAQWLEHGRGSPTPEVELDQRELEAIAVFRRMTSANRLAWMAAGRALLETQSDQ